MGDVAPTECRSCRGYVVGRLPYGNTSEIVRCLTLESGRVSVMAKGAQRAKSPFLGAIDLFYEVDMMYAPARRSDLHSLREIRMLKPHLGVRQSYANLLAAQYFAELVEAVTENDTPIPKEYELFDRAISYLEDRVCPRRAVIRFETRLLEIAGVAVPGDLADEYRLTTGFQNMGTTVPSLRRDLLRLVI